MNSKYVFFDLDGTITDSSSGIINSLQHSLKKQGINNIENGLLKTYIGASLKSIFGELSGNKTPQYLDNAVALYREYYNVKGIYENELYDGIVEVFETLKNRNYTIALATAKPTYFAKIILEHFKIDHFFDVIVGSHLDGSRVSKNEIIYEVRDRLGNPNPQDCFMIGDRTYDISGGKFHDTKTIGVHYGYGKENEFLEIKPDYEVNKPIELLNFMK